MVAKFLQRSDGHKLAYEQTTGTDQRPGIIFLGGFKSDMTGSKALFLEQWCQLQGRHFIRFDYLGHGASSGSFAAGTIGRWRDDALAVLDELSNGPQILVGSSMGGWMMLLTALARPERIAGLIGIASAPDFTERLIWQRLNDAQRQQLQQTGVWQRSSEYSEEPYPITLQLIEEGRNHLLLNDPIQLNCPVRLLHGMSDEDVPWQLSTCIAEQITGHDIRITLLKDGEHRLSRPQDLQLLAGTLLQFPH